MSGPDDKPASEVQMLRWTQVIGGPLMDDAPVLAAVRRDAQQRLDKVQAADLPGSRTIDDDHAQEPLWWVDDGDDFDEPWCIGEAAARAVFLGDADASGPLRAPEGWHLTWTRRVLAVAAPTG